MSSTARTADTLLDILDSHIPPAYKQGTRLLAAFSGGADSTALLALLSALRNRRSVSLIALYVDHALRPRRERTAELATVIRTAETLEVPLLCSFLPPGYIAAGQQAGGVEASARRVRYRILREAAERLQCTAVCTAHTRDDQVETVLMRVLQGAGLEGIAGIGEIGEMGENEETGGPQGHSGVFNGAAASASQVLRPLLSVDRTALQDYLRNRGLGWSEDSTNRDEHYLRNALRHRLLPVLRETVPGCEEGILTLAEKAGKARDALLVRAELPPVHPRQDGAETDWRRFSALTDWGREEMVYRLFHAVSTADEYRLPYRFVRTAAEQAGRVADGIAARGHGITLEREGNVLRCSRSVVSSSKIGYLVRIEPGRYRLWERMLCTVQFLSSPPEEGDIPYSRELQPYLLRSPREGDRIALSGGHRKALKQLLYELDIPAEERFLVPVVQNRGGIAAVCAGPWGGTTVTANEAQAEAARIDGCIRVRFHYTGENT